MRNSKSIYQWQGEEVEIKFGLASVKKNKEKPLYWYNYECTLENPEYESAYISSIQVKTKKGSTFLIANHFGIGAYKLINGGYPNIQHFSFGDDAKFEEHKEYEDYDGVFQLEEFEEHESNRRKWQKDNFPIEFENSERLRKLIVK